MKKVTAKPSSNPVEQDAEILAFRAQFDDKSPLDEIIRMGAQQMLQTAIDAEVTGIRRMESPRSLGQTVCLLLGRRHPCQCTSRR